jgi:hypothetical protein
LLAMVLVEYPTFSAMKAYSPTSLSMT